MPHPSSGAKAPSRAPPRLSDGRRRRQRGGLHLSDSRANRRVRRLRKRRQSACRRRQAGCVEAIAAAAAKAQTRRTRRVSPSCSVPVPAGGRAVGATHHTQLNSKASSEAEGSQPIPGGEKQIGGAPRPTRRGKGGGRGGGGGQRRRCRRTRLPLDPRASVGSGRWGGNDRRGGYGSRERRRRRSSSRGENRSSSSSGLGHVRQRQRDDPCHRALFLWPHLLNPHSFLL